MVGIPQSSLYITVQTVSLDSKELWSHGVIFHTSFLPKLSGHGSCGQRDVEERAVPIDEGVKHCVKHYVKLWNAY